MQSSVSFLYVKCIYNENKKNVFVKGENEMMNNNVKLFLGKIHSDEALYARLVEESKAYTGEKTDEAVWDSIMAPIAKETGYDITLEDYKAYVNEIKESEELSEDEMQAVAGGATLCIFVGFGNKAETGSGWTKPRVEEGLGACAYVGVGLGLWGS